MPRIIAAVFAGAAIIAATGAALPQEPERDERLRACTSAAQRVQDLARVLRNGVTTGADRTRLERVRVHLANAVHNVAEAEEAWLDTLDEESRIRLHDSIALMGEHREELTSHLEALTADLSRDNPDGRRVQELARAMARHAASWEHEVRRAPAAVR